MHTCIFWDKIYFTPVSFEFLPDPSASSLKYWDYRTCHNAQLQSWSLQGSPLLVSLPFLCKYWFLFFSIEIVFLVTMMPLASFRCCELCLLWGITILVCRIYVVNFTGSRNKDTVLLHMNYMDWKTQVVRLGGKSR